MDKLCAKLYIDVKYARRVSYKSVNHESLPRVLISILVGFVQTLRHLDLRI
jgi:hypothetical protein